jgi:hypothetical protein
LSVAVAQAREVIDDHARAIPAVQIFAPAIRLVTVHVEHETAIFTAAQHAFDFFSASLRRLEIPVRCKSCVHHRATKLRVMVQQRPAAQPLDKFLPVRRFQHGLKRIVRARPPRARVRCQQVQIVIA